MLKEKEDEIQRLATENEEHLKRTADLTAYIQQASHDREQIIQQYTSYSQQLTVQIEDLTKQLNEKVKENHACAQRESIMVENVQRLETQLQNNSPRHSPEKVVSQAAEDELRLLRLKMTEWDKKILELQVERDNLQVKTKVLGFIFHLLPPYYHKRDLVTILFCVFHYILVVESEVNSKKLEKLLKGQMLPNSFDPQRFHDFTIFFLFFV